MSSQVFSGTIPALMTPCDADRRPDFDALVRTGRELVDAGCPGLVYCGSMGDWPLLTLEQRMEGVERLTTAGLPVIVGTGAQNTAQAAALARHAKTKGARGLMIIPRVLSRGSSAPAQRGHFASVLEAAVDLPSVIYNSPYYGFQTRAELFFELRREYPHLVGFKEFGGAESLSYAAEHIAGREAGVALMVGRRHPGVPRRRQLRGVRASSPASATFCRARCCAWSSFASARPRATPRRGGSRSSSRTR